MTLMDDPSLSTDDRAVPLISEVSRSDLGRGVATPGHVGVSVVLPGSGADHALTSTLERMPDVVDELILVRGGASRIDHGALQRAGFAAARNACIVMAGHDIDLSAMERFIEALRSGCAGVIAPRVRRAG
jgi:hypothetical protein